MKKTSILFSKVALALLCLVMFNPFSSKSQNGPACDTYTNVAATLRTGLGANTVRSVSVSGSTVYAATDNGLSISTDGGASFTNKTTTNGLGNNIVFGVYASGSTVYAATNGGLSISTDGGASFTNYTTSNGLRSNFANGVYASGSTVYAAIDGGLSISTDGGTSFTNKTITNGLGSNIVKGVYASGSTVYAATNGGLSISTDGGASFTNKTTTNGLGDNLVIGVYASGSMVYAATNGGLSISTDGGASFTNKTTANGLGSNAVNGGVYASGSTVYAPTAAGLSISTDGGASFTNKTTTNGLGNNNSLGVYVSGSTIYAATSGGLSISTDAGASFLNTSTTKPSGSGLGNNTVKGVYASGSTVYAATNGGLSISTDGGASFTNKTTANGLGNNNVNGVYASGSTIYAATNGGGLSISTDGGASFTNKTTTNGLGNNSVKGVYASVSTIYAATNGGLSISTDGGAIFTNYTTSNGLGNNIVNGVYASGSTVYVATGNGLSISTDGGTSFTNKTTTNGLGDNYVNGVYASGSTVYAATINGLSISTDGGASFTNKNTTNGLGNNNVRGVYASGSTVYAATQGGLSISTDSGAIFTNYTTSNGLGNNIVNGVYASGSTVYVATSGGLSSCSSISCTPTTSTQTVSACGSYVWNGTTYTASNDTATWVTTNAGGCDSTVTLNLTINNATSSSETQTACGSYLWNGTTYTTSGTKTFTTTNAAGCDSVVTLNLTIKNATSSSETQSACGSYLWNGTTYTTSGAKTFTTTNAAGCDSVVTLNLTINVATSSSVTQTACGSYLWNGTTYTSSGTYTFNTTNAAGCDSVVILNLTIKNATSSSVTQTACGSYLWNGTTYTSSGTYTFNTTNAAGCDSVVTLNLTINCTNAQYVPPTHVDGAAPNGILWDTVLTGRTLPVRTTTAGFDGVPGAVMFYDKATGKIGINPNGLSLNLVVVTYTSGAVNISSTTAGPFIYPGGTATNAYSPTTGTPRTFPAPVAVTGLPPTTFRTRVALTIGAPLGPALATTGDANNIASTDGFLNRPWSFGSVVNIDSLIANNQALSDSNFKAIGQNNNANANLLGYGPVINNFSPPKGVFHYSINGVVGQQVGAIVFYSSTPTCTAPTLSSSITNQSCSNLNDGAIDLTATGGSPAPTFAWSGPNSFTSTSEDISNLAPGQYTVTATSGTCTSTATYTVNAGSSSQAASVSIASNATANTICAGTSVTFTATPTNGGASPSYQWKLNDNNVGSNISTYTTTSLANNDVVSVVMTSNATCATGSPAVSGNITTSVNQSTSSSESQSACGSYLWNGTTYTTSGAKTFTTTNAAGCDSVVTLNLTINSIAGATENVTSCLAYTWHGTTYSVNGTYNWTGTTANGCDSTITLNLTIPKTVPNAPASITQTLVSNDCGERKYRFTASNIASGLQYYWFLPSSIGGVSGVTLDSGSVLGQTIRLAFVSNNTALASDSIYVAAYNGCRSNLTGRKLVQTALAAPLAPLGITIQPVAINVCGARKYRYIAPALPAAAASNGPATGWEWAFTGALGASVTIDSGSIQSRVVVVRFSSNLAAVTGDSVKLRYSSNCGNSGWKAMKLTNTVLSIPSLPFNFTQTPVVTNVCNNRVYRFTAPALLAASGYNAAATGYLWSFVGTLGSNALIDSGTVNSRVIRVVFTNNNPAGVGDSVRLAYTSGCGTTANKSYKMINTLLGAPLAPASITIQTKSDLCNARTYRYIAPAVLPLATTTAGAATGYLWSAPTGTVGSTGTIDSGDVNSRIITVTYTSNVSAGVGDSIRLRYTSGCGDGKIKAQKLSNLVKTGCAPISKNGSTSRVPTTVASSMEVNVYPNPTTSQFNVQVKSSSTEAAVIRVLDLTGRFIKALKVSSNSNVNIGSDLKAGAYMLEVKQGKEVKMVRVEKF